MKPGMKAQNVEAKVDKRTLTAVIGNLGDFGSSHFGSSVGPLSPNFPQVCPCAYHMVSSSKFQHVCPCAYHMVSSSKIQHVIRKPKVQQSRSTIVLVELS